MIHFATPPLARLTRGRSLRFSLVCCVLTVAAFFSAPNKVCAGVTASINCDDTKTFADDPVKGNYVVTGGTFIATASDGWKIEVKKIEETLYALQGGNWVQQTESKEATWNKQQQWTGPEHTKLASGTTWKVEVIMTYVTTDPGGKQEQKTTPGSIQFSW